MTSAFFLAYAAGHLLLFGVALVLFVRHRHLSTIPLLIVTFGLVYDNLLLGTGSLLGHGEALAQLSVPRFFLHAVATPMLMLAALGLVQRSGETWAGTAPAVAVVALLVVAMVALGFYGDMLRLMLEPKRIGDLVSYGNAAGNGPPVAPLVTTALLLAAGILVWRNRGGPWLLTGALVQFAASAAGDAVAVAGNMGELALLAALVFTDRRLARHPAPALRRTG